MIQDVAPIAGGMPGASFFTAILDNQKIAHLVASGHRILSGRQVPGLTLHTEERPEAIVARIRVAPEIKIAKPVHLCQNPGESCAGWKGLTGPDQDTCGPGR